MDRISKGILTAVTAAAIGTLTYTEVFAQGGLVCAKHAELSGKLKGEYNEVETDFGIVNDKAALVIFTSPEGETWTAVIVGTDGYSCVLSVGEHWSPGIMIPKGDPA